MNASVDKRSIKRLLRGSLMRSLTNEPFIMSRLLAGWQECISAAAGTGMMDNLEEYERMPSSGSWRTPERENLCACAVAGWKISGFFLLFFFTMLLLLTFCANGGGGGEMCRYVRWPFVKNGSIWAGKIPADAKPLQSYSKISENKNRQSNRIFEKHCKGQRHFCSTHRGAGTFRWATTFLKWF